jgi:hypothetical protein
MFDSWERLLAMQIFINVLSEGVAGFGPFRYDRSRTKDQVFAPTTAAPVSAALVYAALARRARGWASASRSVVHGVVNTAREGWRSGSTLIGMPAPQRGRQSPPSERRVA